MIDCALQVCFEIVGYLLEELRDNNNLEAFRKDVETSNIFIGSLIFIEELAEKVRCCPCESLVRANSHTSLSVVWCLDKLTYLLAAFSQITSVVGPNRDRLDACLIFPSMPAVMKLNKLGTFSMAQLGQSKSIIGDFIKSARKVRAGSICTGSSHLCDTYDQNKM